MAYFRWDKSQKLFVWMQQSQGSCLKQMQQDPAQASSHGGYWGPWKQYNSSLFYRVSATGLPSLVRKVTIVWFWKWAQAGWRGCTWLRTLPLERLGCRRAAAPHPTQSSHLAQLCPGLRWGEDMWKEARFSGWHSDLTIQPFTLCMRTFPERLLVTSTFWLLAN